MSAITLSHPCKKLLIIGSAHKLNSLQTLELQGYDWIILNGGICHPSFDIPTIKSRINQIQQYQSFIYVAGRYDLQCQDIEVANWVRTQPNVVIADFPSRSLIIVDGGIPRNIKNKSDLLNNWEISFVSHIDGKSWHHSYNGSLGYVISNNPITDKTQHFDFSMQLGIAHAQEVDEIGLKRSIRL